MKLVVDTNVLVSAFLWQGVPGRWLEMAGTKEVRLFASRALLEELADVLGCEKLAKNVAATGLTVPRLQELTPLAVVLCSPLRLC